MVTAKVRYEVEVEFEPSEKQTIADIIGVLFDLAFTQIDDVSATIVECSIPELVGHKESK
jgi:hypothetical protein